MHVSFRIVSASSLRAAANRVYSPQILACHRRGSDGRESSCNRGRSQGGDSSEHRRYFRMDRQVKLAKIMTIFIALRLGLEESGRL
jgi:hypothetical protein